ncbi:L,D-transpeptidase family protein [Undibacterium sp. TJN19]|uniref:L,D-transpeptidase family protein n=1 Tax=Undibacterium sp. TJN19 TaxID=3413055 RepID=UPI003BF105E4
MKHSGKIIDLKMGVFLTVSLLLFGCQSGWFQQADTRHQLIISVPEQKMLVMEDGRQIASYPVSTAKRGIGDLPDSYMTPGGRMQVAEKIGAGMPLGTVFKDRKPTGEIVAADAPGRDPVVTRIFWLRGLEERNRNAYPRFIYIHGTPQESLLGTPASYGCIRMRSADIADLFERIGVGAQVDVVADMSLAQ